MAERLQGTFYSEDGTQYRVTLFVDGYSGSVDSFDLRELKIKYSGDSNNIHHPILASSATITFSIPDSSIRDIFTGLVGAAEEDYTIKIEKGASNDLFWCGFVIPDQVVVQDSPYPYDFSIDAVDGIGRLKKKDYTGSGTEWEDDATILQHLYNVLSFIPLSDFWGASDVYVKARNQIFDNQHAEDEDESPLPVTRVNHRVFRNVDERGRVKYKTAYEALEVICYTFASRFYLSGGVYHFEQVTEYANQDSTITFKRFDKSAGALTDEVLNDWSGRLLTVDRSELRLNGTDDLTVMSGTVNTWLSALSKVEFTYNHFQTKSVFSHVFPPPTWSHDEGDEVESGAIDDNSGASRILISADVEFLVDFDTPSEAEPGMMKFRCYIKIEAGGTTYYCSRTASVDFGVVSYSDAEWVSTGTAWVEFYTDSLVNQGDTYLHRFTFYSPQLPASGDLSVDFEFDTLEGLTGVIDPLVVSYSSEWLISNVYGEVFSDGTVDAQSVGTVFSSTNDNDTNSDVFELDTFIGDGPTGTAFGRLEVYTGANWVDASEWKLRGESTLLPHGARIAREIIIPRLLPAERIEGNMIGEFLAHTIIERSSTRYIFMQGTINLKNHITDGTWCFITKSATLSTTPDTGVDFGQLGDGPEPPPGPYVPPSPPSGWHGGRIDNAANRLTLDSGVVFTTTTGLTTADTGTTFLSVQERDFIHNFFDGDEIDLIHPYTGQSQTVTVDTNQESDKTINVVSFDPDIDFPKTSFVAPSVNWLFRMVSKLRRTTRTVLIVPSHLEIPGDGSTVIMQMDPFFRIPDWMDGYLLSKWTVNVHTAGSGAGSFNIRVTADGTANDLTFDYVNTQETKVLSTYQEVNTGDLVEFFITNFNDTGTRPKGLSVDLQFIARL